MKKNKKRIKERIKQKIKRKRAKRQKRKKKFKYLINTNQLDNYYRQKKEAKNYEDNKITGGKCKKN